MTKHTPGPWECRPSMEYPWDYEISAPASEDRGEDPGEAEANARLIAAAPDLLAALVNLLNDTQHAEHPDCDDGPCPVREARAAIQKATKEQV